MQRGFRWAALVLGLALVLPGFAADEKKKAEKAEPKEKMVPAGQYFGRLGQVESTSKNFTLSVSVPLGRQVHQVNLELTAADDMKVRVSRPPNAFDDKGNPKKYTSKELKELKGSGNLPGYTGDFDNLRSGQVVQVYLSRKKGAPKVVGKKRDEEMLADYKPVVTMVIILAEPSN